MAAEKLTRALIECHLMSFIEIEKKEGAERWAWGLSEMAVPRAEAGVDGIYKFTSAQAAQNYAFGWIRRNRPDIERIAMQEAKDGIAYRASKKR